MTDAPEQAQSPPKKKNNNLVILLGVAAGVFLIWAVIVTAFYAHSFAEEHHDDEEMELLMGRVGSVFDGTNICLDSQIDLENINCMIEALEDSSDVTETIVQAGPQAGANVTDGYTGNLVTDVIPIMTPFYQAGLCPVNAHWHLGAEHYSAGEYDCEDECGPTKIDEGHRRLAGPDGLGEERLGFQCNLYDAEDEMFTRPYEWRYCGEEMQVGQTYEVHWPHSAAGACGTPDQYQYPFFDGVFCNLDNASFSALRPQNIASAVGVQAQVFVIVNDEDYYYPDLFRGMVVDQELSMGVDVARYVGSTTGTSVDNTICSAYTPITWHVDRKCHLISASSFDKMCADMLEQRDDLSEDTHPHGSRELVADDLAANNQFRRRRAMSF